MAAYGSGPSQGLRGEALRGLVFSLSFAIMLLLGSPCVAEPNVRWSAPAECPKGSALLDVLRARADDASALATVDAISAEIVRTRRADYRMKLAVEISGRKALRTLEAQSCDELLNAAVWLVMLAIGFEHEGEQTRERESDAGQATAAARQPDPSATMETSKSGTQENQAASPPSPPAAATTSSTASATTAKATEEREPEPPEDPALVRARRRARWPLSGRISAFGGVFSGAGADVQGTVGLWLGLAAGVLHTQLELTALLPVDETNAGGQVQIWSLSFGVRECAQWGERVVAGPCVGISGLRTAAHSQDFGTDAQRTVFWGVLDLGLQLLWPVQRWLELSLAGGIGLPVTWRPNFTVEGVGSVASAAPWSASGRLGLIYVLR